ncbi:CHASE2 domain-containing protein [Leptolyngbya ohadii]|uniref:CHASE2 domain-containing protein n=1 Tax=Leptolyngbya ohadii TaxID=1962290 RepID=UPI000B59C690|nr:CHASE2 domain-containing protein [Leptolyngbya ohadii]
MTAMFTLKVQQSDRCCFFELSWGRGQRLTAELPDVGGLQLVFQAYQKWQTAYRNHYEHQQRGQLEGGGGVIVRGDTHAELIKAEQQLLSEFNRWLRHAELHEIRATIAKASRSLRQSAPRSVDLLLTCSSELARLPWEAWEIDSEIAATGQIRIARVPANIRTELAQSLQRSRRRARILVILGQDDRLDFHRDLQTLIDSLQGTVEVYPVYLQAGKSAARLRQDIADALLDPKGWEILFFAGHSNETDLTGGELSLAPNITIQIKEIAAELSEAQRRGLQFALFNSCEGLSLAESLVNLGVSQVAVMREKIHNAVAEEFLIQFLKGLAAYQDVHESLIQACEYLETKKRYTYPSAYLVPSLFRHPDSVLFRLRPTLRQQLFPKAHELVMLTALLLLGVLLPVQDWLIGQRMLMQAQFRTITQQDQLPVFPILMVQIDEDSLDKARITDRNPMNRSYLARLVNHLSSLGAEVIGVDYFLDKPLPGDQELAQAVRSAVQKQDIQFVFAAHRQPSTGEWLTALPEIANANSTPGNIGFFGSGNSEVYFVPFQRNESAPLPFAYEVAAAYRRQIQRSDRAVAPPFQPSIVTRFAWAIRQTWLHPIVDFSLPPSEIFQSVPAWQLLQANQGSGLVQNLHRQAVMIVPGGYPEAGITFGSDNFHLTKALRYGRELQNPPDLRDQLPGSELHAYLYEHYLSHRFIIPIPDLWMIGIAAIVGKGLSLIIAPRIRRRSVGLLGLVGGTAAYGLLSFGLYLTPIGILLPIVLPTAMAWTYLLPAVLRRSQ